jgi:hypothetical protein
MEIVEKHQYANNYFVNINVYTKYRKAKENEQLTISE